MKLTSYCKQEFENWYKKTYYETLRNTPFKLQLLVFYSLPLSKQYGVYVDFFDSVSIDIETYKYSLNMGYGFSVKFYKPTKSYRTRQEVRAEAIKKANELYNIK